MAGKRTGRGSRSDAGRSAEQTGRAASPAQVEHALTALEELVLGGRAEEIPRWTAVLWSNRGETQRALLRRLETGPVRVPGLYLDVLAGLAGSRASLLMRQVADNREVPDLLRMEARRRAGWPERTELRARASFLRTLRDPAAALSAMVGMGCGIPVPDGEAFGEALGYLLAMGSAERTAGTVRLVGAFGPEVAWLLRALLSAPDPASRHLALAELLAMRDRGASAAIDRLRRSCAESELTAEAVVALRRFAVRSVGPSGAGAIQPAVRHTARHRRRHAPGAGTIPAFECAALSAIDGQGGQAVTLVRAWDADLRLVVQVLLRDDTGIVDAQGMMRVPRQQAEEVVHTFGEMDCPLVGVSLEEARSVVLWAAERTLAAGRPAPGAFSLWEPYFFEDLCPAPPAEVPDAPHLDGEAPEPQESGVADLLVSPFCDSWHFPAEAVAEALASLGSEVTERVRYAALLRRLCPPEVAALLAGRLRRQAWLLDRSGHARLRDTALASAVGLERASARDLADLPLLRGMLARGLAALRAASTPSTGRARRGDRQ